ncbi:MAG: ampG [Francisellaceae bacterium]|nr:ampG [Francisellaceae bacterium]
MRKLTENYFNPRLINTFLLGFASGLPLALSESTLRTWFATSTVSTKDIGLLTLVSFPYALKFLWAPVMDRWTLPLLGRRRSWILITQFFITLVLMIMAFLSPDTNTFILGCLACILAFFSASQDIAVDAYRTDVLRNEERAIGAALGMNGYRIAMVVSGGFALMMADKWGWKYTYMLMAGLMIIGIISTLLAPEPEIYLPPPKNFKEAIFTAFKDLLTRKQAGWLLLFIIFYKMGDAIVGTMTLTFLLRKVQMSLSDIGHLINGVGFCATIIGTILGAVLIPRMGYFRALLIFGILQSISNLAYMALLWTGPNNNIAGIAVFMENFCAGMATSAFIGLLMGICNKHYTAFQFALLTAFSSLSRILLGPYAAKIIEAYGWKIFYISSVWLSIPGLLLLIFLKERIDKIYERSTGCSLNTSQSAYI